MSSKQMNIHPYITCCSLILLIATSGCGGGSTDPLSIDDFGGLPTLRPDSAAPANTTGSPATDTLPSGINSQNYAVISQATVRTINILVNDRALSNAAPTLVLAAFLRDEIIESYATAPDQCTSDGSRFSQNDSNSETFTISYQNCLLHNSLVNGFININTLSVTNTPQPIINSSANWTFSAEIVIDVLTFDAGERHYDFRVESQTGTAGKTLLLQTEYSGGKLTTTLIKQADEGNSRLHIAQQEAAGPGAGDAANETMHDYFYSLQIQTVLNVGAAEEYSLSAELDFNSQVTGQRLQLTTLNPFTWTKDAEHPYLGRMTINDGGNTSIHLAAQDGPTSAGLDSDGDGLPEAPTTTTINW